MISLEKEKRITLNNFSFVINNWYFKAYCKIIENALKENRKRLKQNDPQYVYYECHHIYPRSLGGSDDKDNLILLTKHEHFLVHWLLTKCISGHGKYSMMYAFNNMCIKSKYHERYIPIYKFAKIIKQNREEIKHSEEAKQKISEKAKRRWENKTLEQKAIVSKNLSEGLNNRTPEEKAKHGKNISEGRNNRTIEEKAESIRKTKETKANKTSEEKADVIRKTKETKANKSEEEKAESIRKWKLTWYNKTPEEKADVIRKTKETKANKSEEEKAESIRKMKETNNNKSPEQKTIEFKNRSEARAYKYTQEENDFIFQQRALGLSYDKIVKAFNQRFKEPKDYVSRTVIINLICRKKKG